MKTIKPPNRGIDAILFVNDKALGGQRAATLSRSMTPIDITNKISAEWKKNMSGLKTWSLYCSGLYIKDEESFDILEDAFMNNKEISVDLKDGNRSYGGKALITSFPIETNFNDTFTYKVNLLGVGELK